MRARFEMLTQARKRYLSENPVRKKNLESIHSDGTPGEPFVFPDLGDVQILGCKLGMEYLAICHDDDAVEEWIAAAIGTVGDPEHTGMVFANVLRGVNVVIGEIISNAGLRSKMYQLALEAWNKDFSEGFES